MAEELLRLFEKASKAARNAMGDGEGFAEEARCTDALKALAGVEVSTSLLMSTQVFLSLLFLSLSLSCVMCGSNDK